MSNGGNVNGSSNVNVSASPVGVPSELQAIQKACGYEEPLGAAERLNDGKVVRRVPDTVVAHVIAMAARMNGVIAGIAFDPAAAKSALAEADEADAVANDAEKLAKAASDHALRKRASIASDVSAIRTALRGYVKTAQGKSLQSEYDELRALAKQAAAARKARKTKAAKSVAPGAKHAPSGAPAATPPATTPVKAG
jgi:hypothetical protein